MTSVDAAAVLLFAAIMAYAVFGGADFGAGFWDLVAGGETRGAAPRALIVRAVSPVWEANHVWLVFTLVILWTAFPTAFASIFLTLFAPLSLAAVGIVLRGSGFAFRKAISRSPRRRLFGATFALSSVVVPYSLGAVAGGIASGRVPTGGNAGDPWGSWLNPTSALGGVLAVSTCAYLAAVYLIGDARRSGDPVMRTYFRRRAVVAAGVAGIVALAGLGVLHADAPFLYQRLTSTALPLVVASAVAGVVALGLVLQRFDSAARVLAAAAVATVIWGWGVAQWPYVIAPALRLQDAAAPAATLNALLAIAGLAAVTVVPSFVLLLTLSQRSVLDEEPTPPQTTS